MVPRAMNQLLQHLCRTILVQGRADRTDGQLLEDYICRRDEAAFAGLVWRHGPMVWGVCRRVLCNYHDAEDAFQATFLVLVRKATSIVPREMVANWLYGVAHQTALKARATAATRKSREKQVATMPEPAEAEHNLRHDLQPLLDQELSRLPNKYRAVIVLCDLEGKTRKEAAGQLGVPEGTVAGQLARARTMLAKRMARHGLAVSSGVLTQEAASAGVPTSLVFSTIKVASLVAVGTAATGSVSVKVATLVEGVMKAMLLAKLRNGMAVTAALTVTLGIGAGLFTSQRAGSVGDGTSVAYASGSSAQADKPPKPVVKLQGTVLTAEGKPAAGAVVWAAQFHHSPLQRQETTADAKGRYTLGLEPGEWWVWARRGTQGGEAQAIDRTIRIVAGQEPEARTIRLEERGKFRGRLLQAETDKPIPGGKLFIDNGLVLTADSAGRFQVGGLARTNHEAFVVAPGRMRMRVLFDTTARAETELDVPVPRAGKIVGRVTDLDGKPVTGAYVGRSTSGSYFSINGLWLACDAQGQFEYDDAALPGQPTRLSAAAPGYVKEERDGLLVPDFDKPLQVHFRLRPKPSDSELRAKGPGVAKPQQPDEEKRRAVSGVVRGPDKKPVAGVLVRWGYQPYVDAVQMRTNKDGRFRLTVPDKANMLAVLPKHYPPQFPRVEAGGDQKVEVQLQAGRIVRGQVLDEDGKPVKDVQAVAAVPVPDPRMGGTLWLTESAVRTDSAGQFEIQGVPNDTVLFDFVKPGMSDVRNQQLDANNTLIVKMAYGGAISGRVVDREGKPIRNFRVLVNFPRPQQPGDNPGGYFAGYCGIGVRFSSADGSFVLTGVRAGSVHRITALAEGHGEATTDRVSSVPLNRLAKTKPVTLRAGPPVHLRVRALTNDLLPIVGARVTLVNSDPARDRFFAWGYHDASWDDMVRGRTAAGGWADFPALMFSGATVLVQVPGFARHRSGWRDGQKELTIQLAPEAVLTGEVCDSAGKPLKAVYISLRSGSDQISAKVGSDDKGRFRIAELPAGEWMIVVSSDNGRTTLYEEKVVLKAGASKELQIVAKKE
jgi:RNA polymerase sigma factor (sigma-70 family)